MNTLNTEKTVVTNETPIVETPVVVEAKPEEVKKVEITAPAKKAAPAAKKVDNKAPAKKSPNKKTPAPSMKVLEKLAVAAMVKAHESVPNIKKLEDEAVAGIMEVRKLVGKPEGRFTVFGNLVTGMSGRLDEALMQFKPTEFDKILCYVAEGKNPTRRSDPKEHEAMVTQLCNHLKRCSANGVNSERKFKKPLKKVGLDAKSSIISKNMAPTRILFMTYAAAMKPKKVEASKEGTAKAKDKAKDKKPAAAAPKAS